MLSGGRKESKQGRITRTSASVNTAAQQSDRTQGDVADGIVQAAMAPPTVLRADDCNVLFFVAAFSTRGSHLALLETWLKVSPGRPPLCHATRTLSAILLIARRAGSGDRWGALNKMGCRSWLGLQLFLYRVLLRGGLEVIG